jgi:hypothetical protein
MLVLGIPCEFDESHDDRKWALLLRWINIFLEDDRVFFHFFVFEKSADWEPRFPTPHDYFAHQILFGLANKMKPQGSEMQTLFHDVDTITAIMDRRSANSGFILRQEDSPSISIGRINELETIYEKRMLSTLRGISNRLVNLRFSFANSRCFDGLQLCDCLTYIVRQQLMSQMGIEANAGKRGEFVNLFGEHFANGNMQTLKDLSYCRKFNYFRGN